MQKYPIEPKRLRRVPAQFSWVDHRLIRQNRLRGVEPCGWALDLFLLSVGDEQGLSYYSDTSICQHLGIGPEKGVIPGTQKGTQKGSFRNYWVPQKGSFRNYCN
jgi:hypothetical protein